MTRLVLLCAVLVLSFTNVQSFENQLSPADVTYVNGHAPDDIRAGPHKFNAPDIPNDHNTRYIVQSGNSAPTIQTISSSVSQSSNSNQNSNNAHSNNAVYQQNGYIAQPPTVYVTPKLINNQYQDNGNYLLHHQGSLPGTVIETSSASPIYQSSTSSESSYNDESSSQSSASSQKSSSSSSQLQGQGHQLVHGPVLVGVGIGNHNINNNNQGYIQQHQYAGNQYLPPVYGTHTVTTASPIFESSSQSSSEQSSSQSSNQSSSKKSSSSSSSSTSSIASPPVHYDINHQPGAFSMSVTPPPYTISLPLPHITPIEHQHTIPQLVPTVQPPAVTITPYVPAQTVHITPPQVQHVAVTTDIPVTHIQEHHGVQQKTVSVAQPGVHTQTFEIRRPAIQKQFYDIEERVIVRPAGSVVVEIDQPLSKTAKGAATIVSHGGENSIQQTGHNFGQQTGQNFGQQTGQHFGQHSGHNFGQQTGQQSGHSFGQQSGHNFGQQSGHNFGQQTGQQTHQQSGHNFGQQSGQQFGQQFGHGISVTGNNGFGLQQQYSNYGGFYGGYPVHLNIPSICDQYSQKLTPILHHQQQHQLQPHKLPGIEYVGEPNKLPHNAFFVTTPGYVGEPNKQTHQQQQLQPHKLPGIEYVGEPNQQNQQQQLTPHKLPGIEYVGEPNKQPHNAFFVTTPAINDYSVGINAQNINKDENKGNLQLETTTENYRDSTSQASEELPASTEQNIIVIQNNTAMPHMISVGDPDFQSPPFVEVSSNGQPQIDARSSKSNRQPINGANTLYAMQSVIGNDDDYFNKNLPQQNVPKPNGNFIVYAVTPRNTAQQYQYSPQYYASQQNSINPAGQSSFTAPQQYQNSYQPQYSQQQQQQPQQFYQQIPVQRHQSPGDSPVAYSYSFTNQQIPNSINRQPNPNYQYQSVSPGNVGGAGVAPPHAQNTFEPQYSSTPAQPVVHNEPASNQNHSEQPIIIPETKQSVNISFDQVDDAPTVESDQQFLDTLLSSTNKPDHPNSVRGDVQDNQPLSSEDKSQYINVPSQPSVNIPAHHNNGGGGNEQQLFDYIYANRDGGDIKNHQAQSHEYGDVTSKSRVISATPAPKYAEPAGERVHTRRIVVNNPLETVQVIQEQRPVTNFKQITVQQPTYYKTASVGLKRVQTSVPVFYQPQPQYISSHYPVANYPISNYPVSHYPVATAHHYPGYYPNQASSISYVHRS